MKISSRGSPQSRVSSRSIRSKKRNNSYLLAFNALLIDECIDEHLRHLFPSHDCQTVRFAKLAGLSNGDLLSAAEVLGFDVILTVDQNFPFQQNLEGRRIVLLILCGPTSRLRDLKALIPAALATLASIKPGEIVRIS